jgi:hypothetical protein
MPRKSGWSSGNPSRPPPGAGVAHTDSFCFSANFTAASQPPHMSMSGPAIIAGFFAFASFSTKSPTRAGSGPCRPPTSLRVWCATSASSTSASQSSNGIETNTGPRGGSDAR